ncbi:hypothetical protein BKA83DRAFT_4223940, partial [Pisolithus microcarpus]
VVMALNLHIYSAAFFAPTAFLYPCRVFCIPTAFFVPPPRFLKNTGRSAKTQRAALFWALSIVALSILPVFWYQNS